jgi:NAD-dependent dihydropyrimidine dehydrogenase PreA subunit
MKTLQIDLGKCNYGSDCSHECEEACATRVFKFDDPAKAAIRIRPEHGKGQASLCDQCGDCIIVCPADALRRNKQGAVMLDKKLCVACYTCVGFCEKNVFMRTPGQLEPYKCSACSICVKACPKSALEIAEVPTPAPRII